MPDLRRPDDIGHPAGTVLHDAHGWLQHLLRMEVSDGKHPRQAGTARQGEHVQRNREEQGRHRGHHHAGYADDGKEAGTRE